MNFAYQNNNMMRDGFENNPSQSNSQGYIDGRHNGPRMMQNQEAVQERQNNLPGKQLQQYQGYNPGKFQKHNHEMFFGRSHFGTISAISIILIWTFLILGIIALAKSIFASKQKPFAPMLPPAYPSVQQPLQ